MSTRSFIGYRDENDKFVGMYCHYDGYPEHVGKILVEHHNSFTAAEAIVEGSQIRNFDHDGTIVRFGDGDGAFEDYESLEEVLSCGFDYAYVYSTNDNCWKCYGRGGGIEEFDIPGNEPWA